MGGPIVCLYVVYLVTYLHINTVRGNKEKLDIENGGNHIEKVGENREGSTEQSNAEVYKRRNAYRTKTKLSGMARIWWKKLLKMSFFMKHTTLTGGLRLTVVEKKAAVREGLGFFPKWGRFY
ncbi:TPA_asm: hypothetical protein HUJ06_032024 [Nelumbo nucifera]|uniref:Uncharacterized protein n=1 Tax=Nelumbo nucifera TaxID=4432 RepID=A0A822ZWB4_NELNU|nr:TPA_asm: hypothetical protein HUJ06_018481 [Nelumbo nucifera]DAD49303.1 TPA_asm: hypothetical protein HUJ06_032024 [Nelumbo nucifera]